MGSLIQGRPVIWKGIELIYGKYGRYHRKAGKYCSILVISLAFVKIPTRTR